MEPAPPRVARRVGAITLLLFLLLALLLFCLGNRRQQQRKTTLLQIASDLCHLHRSPQPKKLLKRLRPRLRRALRSSLLPDYGHFLLVLTEHAARPWNCQRPPQGRSATDLVTRVGFALRCGRFTHLPHLARQLQHTRHGKRPTAYLLRLISQLQQTCSPTFLPAPTPSTSLPATAPTPKTQTTIRANTPTSRRTQPQHNTKKPR